MNLYLIALIPHLKLREQIRSLKEEMKDQFNAKHALKSPAHITLQMPYKRNVEGEHLLINTLQYFASKQHAFNINLDGFGCFAPRVIFVKVTNHKPIVTLHCQLQKVLMRNLKFKENEITQEIHPHITIATRDLTLNSFKKAWAEFENHKFTASFLAKNIFLLKHNGKYWDNYKEFLFQK